MPHHGVIPEPSIVCAQKYMRWSIALTPSIEPGVCIFGTCFMTGGGEALLIKSEGGKVIKLTSEILAFCWNFIAGGNFYHVQIQQLVVHWSPSFIVVPPACPSIKHVKSVNTSLGYPMTEQLLLFPTSGQW